MGLTAIDQLAFGPKVPTLDMFDPFFCVLPVESPFSTEPLYMLKLTRERLLL